MACKHIAWGLLACLKRASHFKKLVLKKKIAEFLGINLYTNFMTLGKFFAISNFIHYLLEKRRSAQPKVFLNL